MLWFLLTATWVTHIDAKTTAQSAIRKVAVDSIVLHAIGGPYCDRGKLSISAAYGDGASWIGFFSDHKVLGIHYVIDRSGIVFAGVAENRVANHTLGWNQTAIGIELINHGNGKETFPKAQIDALIALVKGVMIRHSGITKNRVVRHSDADQSTFECSGVMHKRKTDPGVQFDYIEFMQRI